MTTSAVTPESSLLLTLEEIAQLISHSHDPSETLANIVTLIRGRFATDVCSVYILEPDRGELVLGATIGLRSDCVGCLRMRLDEGLTGLAAQTLAPVIVDDAFQHPRFKYFPDAGEDRYHSFLGIPLIEGGVVQGVLVVQAVEPRRFSTNETRMLVTVASQLAPLVSSARLLGHVVAVSHAAPARAEAEQRQPWRGTPLGPGVGWGEAYLVSRLEELPPDSSPREVNTARVRERLARAMEAAKEEVAHQSQRLSALAGEEHGAILQAHLMLLQDRTLERDLNQSLARGLTAEAALLAVRDQYVAALQKVSTPFFQERAYDVKDVFRRIRWHLQPHAAGGGAAGERVVLVAHEASVLDLFSVDFDRLAAIVIERGGPQSHAAILARSLGIPMVGQIPDLVDRLEPGRRLLVDGSAGTVILDPTPDELATLRPSGPKPADYFAVPADPPEGLPAVEANINLLSEVTQAVQQGATGIGLYRTEFLFLARRSLPGEEEQVGIYRKLLSRLQGRPVSIRTFDLRPNKLVHRSPLTPSAAEALDTRRLLESPPLQKLFKDQVRAILRAAATGPARLLVPLVTSTEQLEWVIGTVAAARHELVQEGLEHGRRVPLGVMVEVAGVVPLLASWAERVDFFAVGTNDLVASALGLDRDDPVGGARQDFLHPGVLRMLHDVVAPARRAGRRVTVCGEMASDPAGVRALAALDVDAVSVPVHQLSPTRLVLGQLSPQRLDDLAGALTAARTVAQVRELLSPARGGERIPLRPPATAGIDEPSVRGRERGEGGDTVASGPTS